jgi:AraC-like DNA-binding protein
VTQPVAMQRAGVFSELPALLAELGVDPAAVLAPAGIDPAVLSPDTRLPFAQIITALHLSAQATARPDIGLMLGQRFSLAHHGLMGTLMRSADTLGQALVDFASWQGGYSTGAVVYLHRMGPDIVFGYGAAGAGDRRIYDCVLVIGARMIAALTDGGVTVEGFHVAHRPPEDQAPYLHCLGKVPLFNQQRIGLILPAHAMGHRLPGANPRLRREVMTALRDYVKTACPDMSTRTRHALRRVLQRGQTGMQAVAQELAMHPRTLRRRLSDEGTTFETLRDGMRFDMARELVELTDLPIADINSALAYSSSSAFHDAFRRWSGTSPMAWREGLRAPVSPA